MQVAAQPDTDSSLPAGYNTVPPELPVYPLAQLTLLAPKTVIATIQPALANS